MTDSNAELVQRQLFELGRRSSSATEGIVVAQDWDNGFVTVDFGGTTQTLKWDGTAPWIGDTVVITVNGQNPRCRAVYGPAIGTVVSAGSSFATVLGDDSKTYIYVDQFGVSASQRVRLDHAGRRIAGVYPAEPADSEYVRPSPPPAPTGPKRAWFNPAWSGNWRPGYAGSECEISSTRLGAYGYGTQIADTIPNSASIRVAQLHLVQNWDNVPGTASSMGLHGFGSAPGSFVNANLSGSFGVAGGSQALNILGTVADALKNGTAFGVGFRSGSFGWRQFAAAPGSGRIYMEW